MNKKFHQVIVQLEKFGFLLESDAALPNVCTLITGDRMRGSWWAHPLAQTIFQVNEWLDDHPDVLIAKVLAGKVTFVHRQLWPELFAVATSNEPWQTRGLKDSARHILKLVMKRGLARSDEIAIDGIGRRELGDSVRLLERRLLIHSHQIHTESGAHAKVLETWERWASRIELKPTSVTAVDAKKSLELRVQNLNKQFNGKATLPWQ